MEDIKTTTTTAVHTTSVYSSSPSSLNHFLPFPPSSTYCPPSCLHLAQSTPSEPSHPHTDSQRPPFQPWSDSGMDPGPSMNPSSDENFSLAFKRPRLDSTGGVAQDSPLWPNYIDRNKPIGIAQPFQKRDSIEIEQLDDVSKDDPIKPEDPMAIKAKMLQEDFAGKGGERGRGEGEGGISTGFSKEHTLMDIKSKNRSRKDILSSVESDSGTDTTSTFDFPFEPPSDLPDDDDSSDESLLAGRVVPAKAVASSGESMKLGIEEDYRKKDGYINTEEEHRGNAVSLPSGKKFHVFLTHSTSDQQWAEHCIVTPLSSRWRVKACYQLMPDASRYDDREIIACMRQSCVIIIGLSPNYLRSGRCIKEWQLALNLSQDLHKFTIIVAAAMSCSRPVPLKEKDFLYLDFIDHSNQSVEKKEYVWNKLVETIGNTVQIVLPVQDIDEFSVSGHSQSDIPYSDCPSQESRSITESDIYRHQEETGQLIADFEAEWEEGVAKEEDSVAKDVDDEGVLSKEGELSSDGDLLNSDPENVSSSQPGHDIMSDGRASDVERADGGRASEVKVQPAQPAQRGNSGDVEEGEVSDSSEEVGVPIKVAVTNDLTSVPNDLSVSNDVTSFYDNLARPHVDRRSESPIKLMRNFNNWVKSVLIRTYLNHFSPGSNALDICCGKGGDLLKWKEGRINHLVCADISSESIAAAQDRYRSPKMVKKHMPPYSADFHVADCTRERLMDLPGDPTFFNISSCQFSVHYSFESYEKAHMMLRNACERLRPGGYFVGTTIDADQLVYRLRRESPTEEGLRSIGNEIFTVTLDPSLDIDNLPLFGARYNFKLHGVVDLPEFLVYFPLLVKMLEPFEMELILRQNFYDFFEEHRHTNNDDMQLLYRMEAFDKQKATMSKGQWEAVGLYLVYVFKKKQPILREETRYE